MDKDLQTAHRQGIAYVKTALADPAKDELSTAHEAVIYALTVMAGRTLGITDNHQANLLSVAIETAFILGYRAALPADGGVDWSGGN